MLLEKTFTHTKFKKRAIIYSNAYTFIALYAFVCACNAATENLANFPYTQTTKIVAVAPSAASLNAATATTSFKTTTLTTSTSPSASPTSSPYFTASSTPSTTSNVANAGTRTILRIYDECSRSEIGFVPCIKKKAISFIDRLSRIDTITIADGVKLVRLPKSAVNLSLNPLYTDNDIESSSLPRSFDDRDTKLTNMLVKRLSYFFNGHTLQVNFPKLTAEEIGRGLEEGRGKMKKMMSMMMMGVAMKMVGMIPVAMGMLYMMAGKALIISKIAMLLSGMMALKKLMSGRGGSGGSSGWSSGGGGGGWSSGGGGGYDRRSLDEAHDLAYRRYSKGPISDIIYTQPPRQHQQQTQHLKPLSLQQQQQPNQLQQEQEHEQQKQQHHHQVQKS